MSLPSPGPVVAGVDGSSPSTEAARAAAEVAARLGTPLHLVRAFRWPSHRTITGLPEGFDAPAVARRTASADLERLRTSLVRPLPTGAVTAALA
jgi:hypothetical protein